MLFIVYGRISHRLLLLLVGFVRFGLLMVLRCSTYPTLGVVVLLGVFFSHCRQYIHLDGIVDVTKVPTGFAIAINEYRF